MYAVTGPPCHPQLASLASLLVIGALLALEDELRSIHLRSASEQKSSIVVGVRRCQKWYVHIIYLEKNINIYI